MLSNDFRLTPVTIDFVEGVRTRYRLTMDPDDRRGRGIEARFQDGTGPADLSDCSVMLYWQHDRAPALRGLEPFDMTDAKRGVVRVHYPSDMGASGGTVTAKIVVSGGDANVDVDLPTIHVDGLAADPSAAPSGDTFSVLAELVDAYRDGLSDITEATDAANSAADAANRAASDVQGAVAEASEAATRANAAATSATDAAASATDAATKATEQTAAAKEATDAASSAAETASASAERADTAAANADAKAERADASASKADAAAQGADESAGRADTAASGADDAAGRANAAAKRAEDGEDAREVAEAAREATMAGYADAESARETADADRAERQADNDARQDANDLAQAKNNADQKANDEAAYNHLFITLRDGEFDPATRQPTVADPKSGPVYRVPKDRPTEANRYDEWYWAVTTDGEGEWEAWTAVQVAESQPVPTDKIDAIVNGQGASGDEAVETTQLDYYDRLVRQRTDAAVADAKGAATDVGASLAGHIADQEERDSGQDEAIREAMDAAEAAAEAIPPTVTSEAAGVLPALPTEGGPLYPTAEGGELRGWLAIPVFDATRAGLVPAAPPEDSGVKVLLNTGWGDYGGGGGMPDHRPLKRSIAGATAARDAAKVRGSEDFEFGTMVTTQGDVDALTSAIGAAQAVLDALEDPDTTQAVLDRATSSLDAALSEFEATIVPLEADTTALTAQESRYGTLSSGVTVSADGKDVAFGSKWVTGSAKSAAETAIETARSAVASATKQSQIASAVATLKSALDTYEQAIKTATANTSALDAAIGAANAAKLDVKTSDTEGSDLPSGSKYVTKQQMATFDAAIQAATTAKTESTTQAQLDAATSMLTAATSTFEGQVKTNWAPPEDIANASWDDVERLANMAADDPSGYRKYIGQEKTFAYGGYNVTARIVDIAKEKTPEGKDVGFIFHIYRGMGTHNMNSSNTTTGGYASSSMKSWLDGLAFPADLHPQEFALKYRDTTSGPAKTINVKVGLMAASNLYWTGCQGENGYSSYFYGDEGEPYQYFRDHDTLDARIHYNSSGGADNAWLLSPYSTTGFMSAGSNGYAGSYGASSTYVPSARFCLGSST